MSIHIAANQGDIAEVVLLPGDPLRAKFIAEHFLQEVRQYNTVRNMFGYTGVYRGQKVSVQGSGMGIPSFMIYAHELYASYNVQKILRVRTTGAIQEDVRVRDIILAQGATTDSSLFANIFRNQVNFSALATFGLLDKAYHTAQRLGIHNVHVGNVLSSDRFYNAELDIKKLAEYGVLAIEMEAAGLYALAAQHKREALAILTVSDHLITGDDTTAEEREQTFTAMMELALETALAE